MRVYAKFEKRDLWVGVYWRNDLLYTTERGDHRRLTLFICLVPCIPIIVQFRERIS